MWLPLKYASYNIDKRPVIPLVVTTLNVNDNNWMARRFGSQPRICITDELNKAILVRINGLTKIYNTDDLKQEQTSSLVFPLWCLFDHSLLYFSHFLSCSDFLTKYE